MNVPLPYLLCIALTTCALMQVGETPRCFADSRQPIVGSDLVFAEQNGLVAVEAEHFVSQTHMEKRAFHITSSQSTPEIAPDADPTHVGGAAGGAYVEVLPDSRRNHSEKLVAGENFSNDPGQLAVLSYRVHFSTPGRYYVWARAFSTGSEDNGLHVGLDGAWPESGRRLQWCEGKNTWRWESKQRTASEHCGVPHGIYLDVNEPGIHTVQFSMREDGFEFDRWLMTRDRDFERPQGIGPEEVVYAGKRPVAFAWVAPQQKTPSDSGDSGESEAPSAASNDLVEPRQSDGDGSVTVRGEMKQWHKITIDVDGPFAHESDNKPNPFVDYRMNVKVTHESGAPTYTVPGYFAADGRAAESSSQSGTIWRAHVSPDKPGRWNYEIDFVTGEGLLDSNAAGGKPVVLCHGKKGSFLIEPSDKQGRDFRAHGRLQYVGERYLRFAGSGTYFLKAGPDAPETLLAYADFDGTEPGRKRNARSGEAAPTQTLHHYRPHLRDWREGDPTWQNGKGKGLIGAINYLASKGCNTISFLPYNAGGDGDNVWPFVARDDKLHYDCSKLDQWQIVFDHANQHGLHLHFKLQENEIDDNRRGHDAVEGKVPESLDGGKLGIERRLYCRELIARFGYELAMLWNLGEENTQSPEEQRDMAEYLRSTDPYQHNIVIHTFPDQQEKVYSQLLGEKSVLTGASLQNSWNVAHQRTLDWINQSVQSGRPWVVCNDEQNPAGLGVPPDPGFQGFDGVANLKPNSGGEAAADDTQGYTLDDIRKLCLWGTLMAGGGGVEYYFGYQLPENDLVCEDFRSRDRSWDYCRIALEFFRDHAIPLVDMSCADELVGNPNHNNNRFCFAKRGELYLVYLPTGGSAELDLSGHGGTFSVQWFNPRAGGPLAEADVRAVEGGQAVSLGTAPAETDEDWLILVAKAAPTK